MTRPSLRLPAPIFDKLLELEETSRRVGVSLAALELDETEERARVHVQLVAEAGQLRDELAALILGREE